MVEIIAPCGSSRMGLLAPKIGHCIPCAGAGVLGAAGTKGPALSRAHAVANYTQ